jgi:AcrR family transcriptional regulator
MATTSSPQGTSRPQGPGEGERSDSRRNRLRLVEAARAVVAERGLDVAGSEIAGRAEVGIGTLYRRFGSKEALVEAAMSEVVGEVLAAARAALDEPDPAAGLADFMTTFARSQHEHRGVADLVRAEPGRRPAAFAELAAELRRVAEQLVERARAAGAVRVDLSWRDVVVLCQAAGSSGPCLDVQPDDDQWRRILAVVLAGLRPAARRRGGWRAERPDRV